jgi:endonuclease YncB( thermonuclease family)
MRRRRRLLPLGVFAIVLGLVLAIVNEPWLDDLLAEKSFVGTARIIDGDSLEIASMRVRLFGIDAPELAQHCTAADGRDYPCGREARERLAAAIAGRAVSCRREGRDRFRRILARCLAGRQRPSRAGTRGATRGSGCGREPSSVPSHGAGSSATRSQRSRLAIAAT